MNNQRVGWQKIRKQPRVVDTLQIVPENADALRAEGLTVHFKAGGEIEIEIHTIEGTMYGVQGAWLIRGVQGELYACDNSILMESYDFIDDDSALREFQNEVEDDKRYSTFGG